MSDYISREAVVERIGKWFPPNIPTEWEQPIRECLRAIKYTQAADVVEVVRCRDCKRGKYDAELNGYWCGGDIHAGAFYCMYGTRLDAQEATT